MALNGFANSSVNPFMNAPAAFNLKSKENTPPSTGIFSKPATPRITPTIAVTISPTNTAAGTF